MPPPSRPAEIALRASSKQLRRDLGQAKKEVRDFGKQTSASLRSAFAGGLGAVASLGSAAGLASIASSVLSDEKALSRLGIQAEVSDAAIRGLSTSLRTVSDATGAGTSSLLGGVSEIVTLTGSFDLARRSARALGMTAQATGADARDLAGVSAALGQNMKIAGDKMLGAFNVLAVQGKAGSVELKDLARELPTASAGFANFGEKGMRAVATLGAALQTVRRSTGTASEAATAFNALGKALIANADKIRKQTRVKVFAIDPVTKRKVARDFGDIVRELAQTKVGRDPSKLIKLLGTDEAFKAFQALQNNWQFFQSMVAKGLQGGGTIERDFERYLASPAGRIEKAWTRVNNTLRGIVTPDRIEKLAGATEVFARVLGGAVDNADKLIYLFGAAKVLQLSRATGRWADALLAVDRNMAGVARGAGLAGRNTSAFAGHLGRAISGAGQLLGVFTASYAITSLIVENLGIFEDKTRTRSTADDPGARADAARVKREQIEGDVRKLEMRAGLGRMTDADIARQGRTEMERAQLTDLRDAERARLPETESQLAFERGLLRKARAEETALRIVERDKARGTNAADDVLGALQAKQQFQQLQALGSRVPSFALPEVDTQVLDTFGREAANLSGEDLFEVIRLLKQQLAEQQKQRELLERVRATDGATTIGGLGAAAPQHGRRPL